MTTPGLIKLFVGVGSYGLSLEGFKTIDIDAANEPDIVAVAADLTIICVAL